MNAAYPSPSDSVRRGQLVTRYYSLFMGGLEPAALSDQQGMVLGQRGSCPDAGRERLTVTVCGTVTFATRVTRDGARLPVTALSPECCFGDGG